MSSNNNVLLLGRLVPWKHWQGKA